MVNTKQNFNKFAGSWPKALSIIKEIAKENGVSIDQWNSQGSTRFGGNSIFSFEYFDKYLSVSYLDGREQSEEQPKEKKFFFVWIEGIEPKKGEKISKVTPEGFDYTTKISESLRIKKEDKQRFKELLLSKGIASWAAKDNSFIPTSYAPKGTLFCF